MATEVMVEGEMDNHAHFWKAESEGVEVWGCVCPA